MPWGMVPQQGTPSARLKETEYQRYMKRCWKCNVDGTVEKDDNLGLCGDCIAAMRDPGYTRPIHPAEMVPGESRELPES